MTKVLSFLLLLSLTLSSIAQNNAAGDSAKTSINSKIAKAILECDSALAVNPKHRNALLLRSFLFKELKEYDKALKDLSVLVNISSDDLDALHRRAQIYFAMGNREKCLEDCDKIVKIEPNNATHYFNRAFYKGLFFDIESSINDYDKAIDLNSKYKEAYANRGFAKINLLTTKGNVQPTPQQTADACKDLNKAKELGDSSVEDMLFIYCK